MKTHCKRGHLRSPDNVSSRGSCKTCDRERCASWLKYRPDVYKSRRRGYKLRTLYGLSVDEFNALLKKQKRRCAICRRKLDGLRKGTTPHVDHTHDRTKKVRGLLCCTCNTFLGFIKDDVSVLQTAVNYLLQEYGRTAWN